MKETKLLQGIDTVIIRVSDIEISKNWYQEKLGLLSVWDDPKMKLAVLDTNSATSLTLWQSEKKINIDQETASYPIFKTPDASALREVLMRSGIQVSEMIQDEHVKYFLFYDPDGNVLEACQVYE